MQRIALRRTIDGVSVTNTFDSYLRRTDLSAQHSSNPLLHHSFGYDAASRLLSVSDNNGNSAWYNYLDYSPLVQQISFTNNGSRRMVTTKQYDYLNRLTSISNFPSASGATPIGFAYAYNNANQRTAITNSDATFWLFQYDSLGQLTSGKRYWPDGTPVAGQQFEYNFDDIGNRRTAGSGGDQYGANLRYQNYIANNLNQYSSRTVPGYVQSLGTANTNAAVTLWGSGNEYQHAYRHGTYFWAELPYNNSSSALWIGLTNFGVVLGGTNADIVTPAKGHVFLPNTPEQFSYDYDGNLTTDAQWNYTWDAENRLIKMAARTGVGPQISLQFDYDSQGRRVRKQVWNNTGWSGSPTNDLHFVSDGWNLVAELDGTNSALRTYAWGLDLSGRTQGAGGVGGLLAISQIANSQISNYLAALDGSGNLAGQMNAADGTTAANYEYGPFGELLRITAPSAVYNPMRFSSKYQDPETGHIRFEARPYLPAIGRFLLRDPVQERGSANSYSYGANDPVGHFDLLGLTIQCNCPESFFADVGLIEHTDYEKLGANVYVAKRGATYDDFLEEILLKRQIVRRMLQSRRTFTAQNLNVSELRRHVQARYTIVKNALQSNFVFGSHDLTQDEHDRWVADPQGFFNSINGQGFTIACEQLAQIIFSTGNGFDNPQQARDVFSPDRNATVDVLIPGDWAYIKNKSAWDNNNFNAWDAAYYGENVFHTGHVSCCGELFWGHFIDGIHDSTPEADWFTEIRRWRDKSRRVAGVPAWRSRVVYPGIGLERDTTP